MWPFLFGNVLVLVSVVEIGSLSAAVIVSLSLVLPENNFAFHAKI
jgi:hypothetical protein